MLRQLAKKDSEIGKAVRCRLFSDALRGKSRNGQATQRSPGGGGRKSLRNVRRLTLRGVVSLYNFQMDLRALKLIKENKRLLSESRYETQSLKLALTGLIAELAATHEAIIEARRLKERATEPETALISRR